MWDNGMPPTLGFGQFGEPLALVRAMSSGRVVIHAGCGGAAPASQRACQATGSITIRFSIPIGSAHRGQ
jgi:hypothetical protein